ncbi:MAG: DNA primase [Hyphomonadaceae bacterium]|nr:DNA primase [Hyphomonadaceae bacterium]
MRFSDAFLRQLRERVSIADYAGKRLAWDKRKSQPAKGDYWACCPFHGEKSPSFHVRDDRGSFHCFGCNESGSTIDLAMKLEGLSFPEAVARLADFAGMALPVDAEEDDGQAQRRRRLYDAAAACAALYRAALLAPEGATARAYLERRGIGPDLWPRFGIGFAPGGWTFALERLTKQGFSAAELADAGLVWPGEAGKRAYDVFRDRVTFEIADAGGKVIAFGGRTMKADEPAKYINSPESALFSKGRTLYRLKPARTLLAQTKASGLVVAEGYLDVIAFERAGIAAVAPLGTALTEEQVQLVWRAGGEPVLCFDGDAAGARAAHRALDLALPHLAPGRTVRIAHAPGGADPDDLFRAEGPDALKALIEAAIPAVDALFARERDARPLTTPEAKADFKKRLRAAAAAIQDGDTKALYLRELLSRADAIVAPPRPPFSPAPRGRLGPGGRGGKFTPALLGPTPELKARGAARSAIAGSDVLRAVCDNPGLIDRGEALILAFPIEDAPLARVRSAIFALWSEAGSIDRGALTRHLQELGDRLALERVAAWPPPKTLDDASEREWMARMTHDLTVRDSRFEARDVAADADDSEAAMARAVSILADRNAARRNALTHAEIDADEDLLR